MEYCYRWSATVEATQLDDGWAILHAAKCTMTTLTDVGAFIWSRLQNPVTLEHIVSGVIHEYDVSSEQANTDVTRFMDELSKAELIERA